MGWIVFISFVVFGALFRLGEYIEDEATTERGKKIGMWIGYPSLIICMLILLGCILAAVGWVWYYLCGGFLLSHDTSFIAIVLDGLMSLVFLGLIIGFILVCFGKK